MNKKKIIIIISLVFLVTLIVLIINSNKNYDKDIANYIEEKGYVLDNSGLYNKKISNNDINYFYDNEDVAGSSYKGLSFDIGTYELIKNDFKNVDGVKLYFIGSYDYKTNVIKYTYRVVYEYSNAIYQGEYNRSLKKFSCNNVYAHDTDIKENNTDVCIYINDLVNDFLSDINSFINNGQYISYMQKAKSK